METKQTDKKKKEVLITHLFYAPRELVFNAWTNPEILKLWFAPDGCTIEYRSLDVRTNGTFHSCIHDPVHGDCWVKGTYSEVTFPEKLVFSMILTDEKGGLVTSVNAGKSEEWPNETITTVTFTAVGDKTSVMLHQTVSEAEAKKTGAYQSWIKMFNKLNPLLQ